ncbi:MAG: hypothetical protein LBB66_08380 [Desulfovibrio sp.]|nr:hypothetical protein [Desulfovibrio sp.]
MRECHAYPGEPEYCGLVEIQPETELYHLLSESEVVVHLAGLNDARMVADALVATLGQVADRAALVNELKGMKPRFITREVGGVVKKFIVIPGYAGLRRFLTASLYGIANAKVVTITASNMSMGQLAAQSGKYARDIFVPGIARKVLIVGLLLDTVQWLASGDQEAERLFAEWTTTWLATGITAGLTPFIAAALGLAFASAPAWLAFAVGFFVVLVGVGIGWALHEIGVNDHIYNLYKRLREAWASDLALIGYDDYVE